MGAPPAPSRTCILHSPIRVLHCERWEPSREAFAVDCCGRLWTAADSEPVGCGRYGPPRTATDGLRPSTDQKVGDSSSSGRATDQGFCTDVKCPNRTRNCTIVKCRKPPPRESQAGQHFPGFLPPCTHHAPTAHPRRTHRARFGANEPPDLLHYRVSNPAPAARTGTSGSEYVPI